MRTVYACVLLALACTACGDSHKEARPDRIDRTANVQIITALLVLNGPKLPMKDGALDVYYLVRKGDIDPGSYSVLRSLGGAHPTDEEIDRGDYTKFPYERHRGSDDWSSAHAFPLLWEKEPDSLGTYAVGMSDGSARLLTEAELAVALGK
jgi:hypothetical protein